MTIPYIGQKYQKRFYVSKEKVLAFAHCSGDNNPIHMNTADAIDYGFYRPVSHGAVLLAEMSRIIGTEFPGGGALWTDVHVDFNKPVFWDEELFIHVEVIQSSEALRMIKLQFEISKENDKILTGTCRVLCLEKLKRRLSMPEIHKRTALVTGGTGGLGLAVVKELLHEGYRVISLSRKENQHLIDLRKQYPRLETVYSDIQQSENVNQQIAQLDINGIHAIIHTASPAPENEKLDHHLFVNMQLFLDIYVKSLIHLVSYTLPYMKKQNYGRIITIGTSFILGTPPPGLFSYVAAKEALWGFTKSLAVQLGRFGITSNMVSPSMMVTAMTSNIPNSVKHSVAQGNPLKRLVEPEEVAKTISFLCGEAATFINGTNIPVTGGAW